MLDRTAIARWAPWGIVGATITVAGCSIYDPSLLPYVGSETTAGSNTSSGASGSSGADTSSGVGGISGAGGVGSSGSTGETGGSAGPTGAGGGSNVGAGGGAGAAGTANDGGSGRGGSAGAGGGAGSSSGIDAGNPDGRGGTAGSGGSASNTDAGCPKCPVGVALSGQFATPEGGGNGMTRFSDVCPSQQVVIGYEGLIDTTQQNSVNDIQTICGQLVLDNSGGYRITTATGATLPQRGGFRGSPFSRMCAANQVVVGFSGRAGTELDQVTFDCAPLNITMSAGTFALSIGVNTTLPAAGGNAGTAFAAIACSPGQVARGTNLSENMDLQSFGLVCTTPVLTGADGQPL